MGVTGSVGTEAEGGGRKGGGRRAKQLYNAFQIIGQPNSVVLSLRERSFVSRSETTALGFRLRTRIANPDRAAGDDAGVAAAEVERFAALVVHERTSFFAIAALELRAAGVRAAR